MIELIHEEIDKEISGKSVNIAVRMLKPELDQFMKGLNKAVQAPAKTAGKAVVNKIHPTSGRQSIKTLIKQGQGVSSIPLADEGLRDFQKIAKKYGVDFAVVRDREKSPPVYTVFFKAKDTDAVTRILQDYSAKQIKKPCYTVKEIQTMLGISRPTAYDLLQEKKFRWFKIGNKYRISKNSFDE